MNANTGMDKATFELARSHALPVCDNAASSFNRRMANFIKALLAPLRVENEALRAEVAALKAGETTLLFTDAAQVRIAKYLELSKNERLGGGHSDWDQRILEQAGRCALAQLLIDNRALVNLDKMLAEVKAEQDAG